MNVFRTLIDTIPTIRGALESGLISERVGLIYTIKMEMLARAIECSKENKPFKSPDHLQAIADKYSLTYNTAKIYFYSKDVKIPKIYRSEYKFIDGKIRAYHYHYDWLKPEVRTLSEELNEEVIKFAKTVDSIEVGMFVCRGNETPTIKISGKFLPDTLTKEIMRELRSAFV